MGSGHCQYTSLYQYNSTYSYYGYGWDYGDYNIFQKLYDSLEFRVQNYYFMCQGMHTLTSYAFCKAIYPSVNDRVLLPHTVLKHTLYFHCGESVSSPILDSISWIYDNTRGVMNTYPFWVPGTDELGPSKSDYDVLYRPTFIDYNKYAGIYNYIGNNSNEIYYYSGLKDENGDTINTGSADYFPPEEMFQYYPYNNCQAINPDSLYYPPSSTTWWFMTSDYENNDFRSNLVHPPSYTLLDAPLLNYNGTFPAGYDDNGNIQDEGIAQEYFIYTPFDLSIINPSEKIIYNPSEVTIGCNLTFPCGYQFLTLHGKYPDKEHEVLHGDYSKEYWDAIPDFEFEYDRDYPVPVNCSTNSSCKSEYILNGGITLTFQPPIIIMDAHFRGTSTTNKTTIHYNPNRTYGNWTYDTASIELDSNKATLPACLSYVDPNIDSLGNKSAFNGNSINLEPGNHLKILNGLTQHPKIQVKLNSIRGAKIQVFDSMGSLKQAETIVSNNHSVDCSSLKPGVYHAVLIYNGEVIDKISFGKK